MSLTFSFDVGYAKGGQKCIYMKMNGNGTSIKLNIHVSFSNNYNYYYLSFVTDVKS